MQKTTPTTRIFDLAICVDLFFFLKHLSPSGIISVVVFSFVARRHPSELQPGTRESVFVPSPSLRVCVCVFVFVLLLHPSRVSGCRFFFAMRLFLVVARVVPRCWQCGDSGQDNVVGGVFRCSIPSCGRFYHRHCVELNTNSNVRADADEVHAACAGAGVAGYLSCPVHHLDACFRGFIPL